MPRDSNSRKQNLDYLDYGDAKPGQNVIAGRFPYDVVTATDNAGKP